MKPPRGYKFKDWTVEFSPLTRAELDALADDLREKANLLDPMSKAAWILEDQYNAALTVIERTRDARNRNPAPRMQPKLSGAEVVRLMRAHGMTVAQLARRMNIPQTRVREIRDRGIVGGEFVRDWREAITGTDPGALYGINPAPPSSRNRNPIGDEADYWLRVEENRAKMAKMTASQINAALDKNDKAWSKITNELIAEGRGRELPSETSESTDPLSRRFQAATREHERLQSEIRRRYGPGAPHRLPVKFRQPARRKNPVPPSSRSKQAQIESAADLYTRFSGHEAEDIGSVAVDNLPPVGVAIGDIDGILYSTVRDNVAEKYIHKFRKADRPLFVVAPDGSKLFLVGGNYKFTERGIIDKSDKKNG